MIYYLKKAYRCLLRIMAQHCIHPKLRVQLYRWSGIKIGKGTYINMSCELIDDFKGMMLKIGEGVSIAPLVSLIGFSSPNNNVGMVLHKSYLNDKGIIINDYVWLGVGCIILPNVEIGRGSIVAANATVSKDIPPYHVYKNSKEIYPIKRGE